MQTLVSGRKSTQMTISPKYVSCYIDYTQTLLSLTGMNEKEGGELLKHCNVSYSKF